MKKLFILTTILPAYAVFATFTDVDTDASACTIASDNVTVTCNTLGNKVMYLSIVYVKGDETSVTITPYHNYAIAPTVYYAIGNENGTTARLMDNLYFTFVATQNKTVSVPCPGLATKMKFVISITGTEGGTTAIKIGARP
jgi:hypothetical protein